MNLPSPGTSAFRLAFTGCMGLLCLMADISPAEEPPLSFRKTDENALPLPRWSEQELRTFRERLPLQTAPGVLPPTDVGSDTNFNELLRTPVPGNAPANHFFDQQGHQLSPRLQAEDMRLFIPESILGQSESDEAPATLLPTPLSALKDVSPEFLAACTQNLPGEYLIDPEQLVPEIQNHDMLRLLEFHAHDARIKLYVMVIAHDQKLPEGVRLEKIASGSLLKTDACLLIYPQGEPWRTRLFVSSSIHGQISSSFLGETIQACLQEALQTSNVHDQLRRYTIHLSTRLFWLQKALGAASQAASQEENSLTEFAQEEQTSRQDNPALDSTLLAWGGAGVLFAGLMLLAIAKARRSLRLRKQRCIWVLPEPETVPRLGGAFTGGGGGMIRYA